VNPGKQEGGGGAKKKSACFIFEVSCSQRRRSMLLAGWRLQDIVIANIVWGKAYKREVGRGVLYCPIIVQ